MDALLSEEASPEQTAVKGIEKMDEQRVKCTQWFLMMRLGWESDIVWGNIKI